MMSGVSESDVTEPMEIEGGQSTGTMEETAVLDLDLKRIAEQFAQYLVVDSKNDVSISFLCQDQNFMDSIIYSTG